MNEKTAALLAEYQRLAAEDDQQWKDYLQTNSQRAFNTHYSRLQALNGVYADLVQAGLTLEDVQQA